MLKSLGEAGLARKTSNSKYQIIQLGRDALDAAAPAGAGAGASTRAPRLEGPRPFVPPARVEPSQGPLPAAVPDQALVTLRL